MFASPTRPMEDRRLRRVSSDAHRLPITMRPYPISAFQPQTDASNSKPSEEPLPERSVTQRPLAKCRSSSANELNTQKDKKITALEPGMYEDPLDAIMRSKADHGLCIGIHDNDGTIRRYSDTFMRLIGRSHSQVVGQTPYQWFHEEDVPRIQEHHAEANIRPNDMPIEYRFQTASGDYIWLSTTTSTCPGYLATLSIDITDRKRREEADKEVQELKLQFSAVLRCIPNLLAIINLDQEATFAQVSDSYQTLTGWSPSDLIGTSSMGLLETPMQIEEALQKLQDHIDQKSEKPTPTRWDLTCKNGEKLPIEAFTQSFKKYIVCISRTLTEELESKRLQIEKDKSEVERHRIEKDLAMQMGKREADKRAANCFAHEMKNNFLAIEKLASLKQSSTDIIRKAQRGAILATNEALWRSVIHSEYEVLDETIRLEDFLRDIATGVDVKVDASLRSVIINSDMQLLSTIIQNGVTNAQKYGEGTAELLVMPKKKTKQDQKRRGKPEIIFILRNKASGDAHLAKLSAIKSGKITKETWFQQDYRFSGEQQHTKLISSGNGLWISSLAAKYLCAEISLEFSQTTVQLVLVLPTKISAIPREVISNLKPMKVAALEDEPVEAKYLARTFKACSWITEWGVFGEMEEEVRCFPETVIAGGYDVVFFDQNLYIQFTGTEIMATLSDLGFSGIMILRSSMPNVPIPSCCSGRIDKSLSAEQITRYVDDLINSSDLSSITDSDDDTVFSKACTVEEAYRLPLFRSTSNMDDMVKSYEIFAAQEEFDLVLGGYRTKIDKLRQMQYRLAIAEPDELPQLLEDQYRTIHGLKNVAQRGGAWSLISICELYCNAPEYQPKEGTVQIKDRRMLLNEIGIDKLDEICRDSAAEYARWLMQQLPLLPDEDQSPDEEQ